MRSQFLTLLCILTFLSCAVGLADAIVSFFQTGAASETARVDRPRGDHDNDSKKFFEDRSSGDTPLPGDPTLIRSLAIAQFAYSLLTLIGAVLMFRLLRLGFWVYIAGIAVGLILPVFLAGVGALATSFGVFFSLIFAGLYSVTLKEMR